MEFITVANPFLVVGKFQFTWIFFLHLIWACLKWTLHATLIALFIFYVTTQYLDVLIAFWIMRLYFILFKYSCTKHIVFLKIIMLASKSCWRQITLALHPKKSLMWLVFEHIFLVDESKRHPLQHIMSIHAYICVCVCVVQG